MPSQPPLFRNHVKNYTLLYFRQSASQLVYLIRSNLCSYPLERVLTFSWDASVLSYASFANLMSNGGQDVRAVTEPDGLLLARVEGSFERLRVLSQPSWEQLITDIEMAIKVLKSEILVCMHVGLDDVEGLGGSVTLTHRTASS
jgi:hypothetical protein